MKYVNWPITLILLFPLFLFSACGETDDLPMDREENNEVQEENSVVEDLKKIKSELCFGGKFVERKYEDFSSMNHAYSAVIKQKDYIFKTDGTGLVKTFVLNTTTDKGYTEQSNQFTWTLSETKPFTLKLKEENMASYALEEVKVMDGVLSFKNGDWQQEIDLYEGFCKNDIINYSVDELQAWHKYDGESRVWITPTILTVKTKKGIMRFIRSHKGYASLGYMQPSYSKDGGPWQYFDSQIYFRVYSKLNNFYDIIIDNDKSSFEENYYNNTKMYYFHVGNISSKFELSIIDNGKEYNVEN